MRKCLTGLGIGLGALAISVLGHSLGVFFTVQQVLSHFLYQEQVDAGDIILVNVDDASLAEKNAGGLGNMSSWPRSTFSTAVSNIMKGEPKAVMLDFLFPASEGINSSDLQELVVSQSNVSDLGMEVLSYFADPTLPDRAMAAVFARFSNLFIVNTVSGIVGFSDNEFAYEHLLGSTESVAAATQSGPANLNLQEDSGSSNIVYGIPLVQKVAGTDQEHVDLKVARVALGEASEGMWSQDRGEYFVGAREVPIEHGKMLIRYRAKPGAWPAVSFADVYRGAVDPKIFEDKIVLVGSSSLTRHDFYYTPMDPDTPMPGVEIHANAIETLLQGDFLRYQNGWEFAGMMTLMLLGVLAFLFLPVAAGTGVFVAELAVFPVAAGFAFERGVILDLIWPVLGLLIAYVAVLVYRNFTEFAEKRKLREAFGHYVAPEVVSQISEHPEQLGLGGERRRITAFFLDIENFTHLSEGLAPQEVVKIINLYFDALSKVIMAQGGSVDKFEGDAIMALFGAPAASTDHAEKACRAALLIQEKMKELNASSGMELHVRMGLATGEAIVGNMGSEARFDYTAMGDTVNTASRLEGANKFYKTRILATEETQTGASGVLLRAVDLVRLKGKDQAVHLYEVRGLKERASAAELETLQQWDEALEAYRAAQWDKAEAGFKAVLLAWPGDGPAETLLTRMALLKMNTPADWDGVWRFEEK